MLLFFCFGQTHNERMRDQMPFITWMNIELEHKQGANSLMFDVLGIVSIVLVELPIIGVILAN